MLTAGLLASAATAHAYGVNECAASRKGSNLGCTANDVSITGIALAPGSPTSCVGGTTFSADLDVTVNFAQPDRYDVGIFLANDGKDPDTLAASGGAGSCTVGILPNDYPFLDLDSNGGTDTCGDGNSTLNGTGSGVLRMENVPVSCQAINLSGGSLYIPFVVTWDNNASPVGAICTSIADPVPNTISKCNSPDTTVAAEVLYGTAPIVVLPQITKSDGRTSINPGDTSTYTVVITNTTGVALSDAVFTDPAADNLTVNSVSCSAAGGAICPAGTSDQLRTAMQTPNMGITIPTMPVNSSVTFTINATVANPVVPASAYLVTNTAYVTVGPLGPTPPANRKTNSANDVNTIIGAIYTDLSTSTKTVVDRNGGEANPGDVLRYTITLRESAGLIAASGVSVTDDIPAYVGNFTLVSIPPGSTNASTGAGTGSNGNGYLNVTGISVPAGGNVTIVFDVTIAYGLAAGTTIGNSATVTNPGGVGATPSAPQVTVSPSALPATGTKQLYVQPPTVSGGLTGPLTRTPYTDAPLNTNRYYLNGISTATLTLSPALQTALNLKADYGVILQMMLNAAADRTVDFTLTLQYRLGGSTTVLDTRSIPLSMVAGVIKTYAFSFTMPAVTIPQGAVLELLVANTSSPARTVSLYPNESSTSPDTSRVELNSATVINIDSISLFNNDGTPLVGAALQGSTVRIRATVSDPFGSYDITSALITLVDSKGAVQVNAQPMTVYADSGAATKTFEYVYALPANAAGGYWAIRVDANEGTEGAIHDDLFSSLTVTPPLPSLTFLKFSQAEQDPVNSTTNPKAIPGADVLYTLQVSNYGVGSVDADTLLFSDPIPANTKLYVGDLGQGGPVTFSDPDADSGFTPPQPFILSYFGDASCLSGRTPIADSDGFDANIRCLRINMTGTMSGTATPATPDFSLTFRVRVE